MSRLIRVVIFTLVVLLIGRNLSFLPTLSWFEGVFEEPKQAQSIKEEVGEHVSKLSGTYSIFFWDFKTGEQFGINEKTVLIGASLNKVPIVATFYHLAGKGEVDLDETVTIQDLDIQDFGTGSIRYEGAGGVYSLKSLARLSFEQSDNTAAHVLGKKISLPKVQEVINSFGLTQTDMTNDQTSVYDMGVLFHKIYSGEMTSSSLTKELIGFMDDSQFEDRLPRLLPKDARVYHKIGDEVGNIHDVGIVEHNGKAYFIGVLTDDQKDVEAAKLAIAEISKMVYDFVK